MALSLSNDFWETNPDAAQQNSWTEDPFISRAIYRRISQNQSELHWIDWLFTQHFADQEFKNVLSIGCGVGDHEIAIAKVIPSASIEAFDFSHASVAVAKDKAKAAGISNIEFFQADANKITLQPKRYDLVLCTGSLHHIKEIEHILAEIKTSLADGGVFIANEYVGDCYNIYRSPQIDIIQKALDYLPSLLKTVDVFPNPSIDQVFSRDPTEGVRSKLIPDFLRIYFTVVDERQLGCSLLHPIYPFLAVKRIKTDPILHEAVIGGLILLDAMTLSAGKSDFSFFLCS